MQKIKEQTCFTVKAALMAALFCVLIALAPAQAFALQTEETGTRQVTVNTSISNTYTGPLTATVTYDDNFKKGEKTAFTINVSNNTKALKYKLFSFEIRTPSGLSSVVDTSQGPYFSFRDNGTFELEISSAGTYELSIQVNEYTPNGDGTLKFEDPARFKAVFTVPETGDFSTIESRVNEIAAQCQQACGDDEYAKALWLNDWIIDNTTYDSDGISSGAESVFGKGIGTCEAYHEAYVMLLNKVGIQTRRVDSAGDDHVWTGVLINGNWYNVDTTWNDSPSLSDFYPDVRHLYFALPSSIMQTVHKNWDGQYLVSYPNRAQFDASSYADNYFVKSGKIGQYVDPYYGGSGEYSVSAHLANKETSFELDAVKDSWPDDYKNVIYGLVAYQLEAHDWGSGIQLSATYSNSKLCFSVTYKSDGSGDSGNTGGDSGNTGNTGDSGNTGGNPGNAGDNPSTTPGGNTGSTTNPGNTGSSTNTGVSPSPAQTPDKAPAVTGTWKKSGGKWWFSYSASTKAAQGGKSWPTNEWVSVKGKKYHFDSKGYMHTNWQRLDGKWRYFAGDGAMRTGWQKVKGTWYYLASDGVMQTGKKTIGGATYYLNPSSGAMKTGWNNESSGWHYYASSGVMRTGWQKVGGKWYYLDPSNGAMKTGWLDVGGKTYLLRPSSGAMITGWARADGVWYYFSGSGVMQKSKWVGNYYVGSDGAMATNTWIGNYHVDSSGKWDKTR